MPLPPTRQAMNQEQSGFREENFSLDLLPQSHRDFFKTKGNLHLDFIERSKPDIEIWSHPYVGKGLPRIDVRVD